MTAISNKDVAKAIYLAIKDKSETEKSTLFHNLVYFLYRKRLLTQVPQILSQLDKTINESEGRVVAKIHSKNDLNDEIKNKVKHSLAERYRAKEIILIPVLNEKHLGGFKIEVNDEVVDLTAKNKIIKLQDYLTKI